jgi:hypothetical protein
MQFIKKHYEKILLSIVLLVLAIAAAALPWQVSHVRERLEEINRNLTVKVKAKPFRPLDDWLSTNKTVLARLESPLNLDFAGSHNLFNPVQWKKMPDGRLLPIRTGSELGPGALKIVQIKELTLLISFDAVNLSTNVGEPPKYQLTFRNEAERNPRPDPRVVSMATPHLSRFELLGVQGATNDPTGLMIKLKEDFEPITVTKEKPYARIEGYSADLVYPPGKNEKLNNKRKGDELKLEGDSERYKIVAITRNEVVLSADSNKRRTIIKYNATNTTASTQ